MEWRFFVTVLYEWVCCLCLKLLIESPHPTYMIVGCSAPAVRAATSLAGCLPTGRCHLLGVLNVAVTERVTCFSVWGVQNRQLNLKTVVVTEVWDDFSVSIAL